MANPANPRNGGPFSSALAPGRVPSRPYDLHTEFLSQMPRADAFLGSGRGVKLTILRFSNQRTDEARCFCRGMHGRADKPSLSPPPSFRSEDEIRHAPCKAAGPPSRSSISLTSQKSGRRAGQIVHLARNPISRVRHRRCRGSQGSSPISRALATPEKHSPWGRDRRHPDPVPPPGLSNQRAPSGNVSPRHLLRRPDACARRGVKSQPTRNERTGTSPCSVLGWPRHLAGRAPLAPSGPWGTRASEEPPLADRLLGK